VRLQQQGKNKEEYLLVTIRIATRTARGNYSERPSNTMVQQAAKLITAKVGGGCSICKGWERPQERCNNQPATSNNGACSHKQQQRWCQQRYGAWKIC